MMFGFKSFCIMGVLNSEVFVADHKDLNNMELKMMSVRSKLELHDEQECHTSRSEVRHLSDQKREEEKEGEDDDDDDRKKEEQPGKKNNRVQVASLKIKIASDESEDSNTEDGFNTPTSRDHKIPATIECPGAPRKPKSIPSSSTKRKAGILVDDDLSQDIESLFPIKPLLLDLGPKIKKVKQGN